MSPPLLHINTNRYNINGLLCTYTEMLRIYTDMLHPHFISCKEVSGGRRQHARIQEFCMFYLVLSLFYSLKRGFNDFIAAKTILMLYQGSRGGPLFSRGGCQTLSRGGGGVQMLISLETHERPCYFPGGLSGPHIPLWIRTWAMSS